jgi:prepilin-type N-terminal cleavage/methylation domain-containing protein/prepilin-type processing-associated H-X9-DG protein
MARSRCKAFTLIELLVVIVILSLLIAMLVPSLRGVWKRYNMTRCQSNLFHIYQAFRLRAADEAMGVAPAYAVAGWKTILLPYLENDDSQFYCTEISEGEAIPGRPIKDFVEFRVNGGSYTTQLEQGPYMLKLSITQYDTARGMGLLGNDDSANNIDTLHTEFNTYVPDGQPHIYWLCMEDHGGDQDFKDVMTRVTDTRDGTVTLECISGYTGHINYLMDKVTGGEIFPTGSDQWSFSLARTKILNVGGLAAAESSYGMNEYAIDEVDTYGKLIRRGVGSAGGKILVLDYSRPVALPDKPDDWATDWVFNPTHIGVPIFARHFGQANVLFSDGSVQPERPADIDPKTTTVAKKWWMP